jgi:predicted TIM-barrel fold metal-dependent hydrolase
VLIIDSHCHAGTGDGFTGPWDTSAPLAAYLRRAAAAGISRTVIFAPFHSDYGRANRQVAGIVRAAPHKFWGYAFVNPARDAGRIRALVGTAVREFGFRGIKVHRHDAPLSREVCDVAREYRLPILYDPQGQVGLVDLVAPEYPDVPFIIPHLGSFADDWTAQRHLIDIMVRHRNVHADTSGVRRFDLIVEAVRRAGAHKVLFGTDGPELHPGLELAKVRALRLPADQLRLVLAGNLLRLLRPGRVPAPADPYAGFSTGATLHPGTGLATRPYRFSPRLHRRRAGGTPTGGRSGAHSSGGGRAGGRRR